MELGVPQTTPLAIARHLLRFAPGRIKRLLEIGDLRGVRRYHGARLEIVTASIERMLGHEITASEYLLAWRRGDARRSYRFNRRHLGGTGITSGPDPADDARAA